KELILKHAIEFIPGRLYLMSTDTIPEQHMNISYVCPEQHFAYLNFHLDFGPNNLGQVIRFCHLINNKFASEAASPSRAICVYSSKRSDHCVNAAFLLTTYMMLAFKLEPTTAIAPISHMMNSYVPYRDAGYGPNTYGITILDCLNGLYKALRIGLLDLQNFNLAEYEFYEKVENGDMNFVTNKFLALATPKVDPGVSYNPNAKYYGSIPVGSASQNKYFPNMRQYVESLIGGSSANTAAAAPAETPVSQETSRPHTLFSAYRMDDLIRFMQERGVSTIVRLNNRTYPSERFVECYLQHHEMYFPDGTTPTDTILQQFLHLAETTPGPIAVHCKAGLGRTGSLIACYLIKHYQFTTSTVIAFMRLIRPGMVVGPQQNWLQSKEREMLAQTPARPLAAPFSCLKSSTWDQMDIFQPPV
ncbi:phosphatases II, partial [Caulochytrium protostelioides]